MNETLTMKKMLWRNGHERSVHTRTMKTDMMPEGHKHTNTWKGRSHFHINSRIWGLPTSGPLQGTAGQFHIFQNDPGYWSAVGAPLRGRRRSSQI